MADCRTAEMTVESPWDPSEVNIAMASTSPPYAQSMEITEFHKICALDGGPAKCDREIDDKSDLSIFDQSTKMLRMIMAVNIAMTLCNTAEVGYVGAKQHRLSCISSETVAWKFRCGIETARRTLYTTTRRGVCQAFHPLHRRYRVNHLDLHCRRLNDTFYYMDTLHSKIRSLGGYKCAQLITNGSLTRVYPMESKQSSNIARALGEFVENVESPDKLICDFATEQTGKRNDVIKLIGRLHINLMVPAEKGWGTTQNHRAETEIRELKTKWKTRMREKQVPLQLWDFGLVYSAEVQSLLVHGSDNCRGIEKITGQTFTFPNGWTLIFMNANGTGTSIGWICLVNRRALVDGWGLSVVWAATWTTGFSLKVILLLLAPQFSISL
jgi:hypothetical protein